LTIHVLTYSLCGHSVFLKSNLGNVVLGFNVVTAQVPKDLGHHQVFIPKSEQSKMRIVLRHQSIYIGKKIKFFFSLFTLRLELTDSVLLLSFGAQLLISIFLN
jgi:hypothetical protein